MTQSVLLSQTLTKIFPTLNSTELRAIIATMEKASFPPETKIFQQGEQGDSLYIIVDGSVQIRYRPGGGIPGDILLANLSAGALFGEMSLFGDNLRSASAVCATTVTLYRFSREDLAQQPSAVLLKMYQSFAGILSQRLVNLNKRFSELMAFSDVMNNDGNRRVPMGELQQRIFAEIMGLDSQN